MNYYEVIVQIARMNDKKKISWRCCQEILKRFETEVKIDYKLLKNAWQEFNQAHDSRWVGR